MTSSDQSFPKKYRVTLKRDFDRVFAHGKSVGDRVLVVTAVRNQLGYSRLGCAISKRAGNAVFRNRWKRIVRESFRTKRIELPISLDFVVRPRYQGAPDLAKVRTSLERLVRKLDHVLPREDCGDDV